MASQAVESVKGKRIVKVFYCYLCDNEHEIRIEDLNCTKKRCPNCGIFMIKTKSRAY